MKNYITIEQADKLGLLNDLNTGDSRNFDAALNLQKEVNEFYPCEVLIKTSEYDNRTWFEYASVVLDKDKHITIRKDWPGKYIIFGAYWQVFENTQFYEHEQALNVNSKHVKPNNVGKLSTKKIKDWIKYWTIYFDAMTSKEAENAAKVEKFKASLTGHNVVWWDEGKRGYIKKNGLRFEFTIDKGYISQEITLDHYETSLETFLKLADNKF